jgi:hypothetical protein
MLQVSSTSLTQDKEVGCQDKFQVKEVFLIQVKAKDTIQRFMEALDTLLYRVNISTTTNTTTNTINSSHRDGYSHSFVTAITVIR